LRRRTSGTPKAFGCPRIPTVATAKHKRKTVLVVEVAKPPISFRVAPDFHKIAAIRDLAALRSERLDQGTESVVDLKGALR
jgi:hypothetical protein